MNSLFDFDNVIEYQPLADKMRPKTLDDFYGQEKLVGKGGPIRMMIEDDKVSSMIFWGPPGVGKTTLAHIIAKETNSAFYELSAVTSGVKEIIWHIFKWGSGCKIVAPANLRDYYKKYLQDNLNNY